MTKYWKQIALVSVLSFRMAADGVAEERVPIVNNIDEIRVLQASIERVVKDTQPATVSITTNGGSAWGSGVVVTEDGLVLTAAHVVQGARSVSVIFPDGREFAADVLGANRTKDTAMVQIRTEGPFPFVVTGDSDLLKVGDFVVALGHAGGHDARRRPPVRFGRVVSKNAAGFFSSDCTLIGGDSGGPIFDIAGKLVGVNSSIGLDLKANNHAGMSGISADWKRLKSGDTWGRLVANPLANPDSPVIGFAIAGVRNGGVLVHGVIAGGAAHTGGIKDGDVIRAVAGKRVSDGQELLIELSRHNPGDKVTVTVLRNENLVNLTVKLMRRGDVYRR